jgi:hypothetical protein
VVRPVRRPADAQAVGETAAEVVETAVLEKPDAAEKAEGLVVNRGEAEGLAVKGDCG